MTGTAVFRTIQLSLAPVVMITCCAIIISGILVRYGAISDRMRAMSRERLELLCGSPGQPAGEATEPSRFASERLKEIDHQIPLLLRRHRLLRKCLQALYLAMVVFVVTMVVIGVAAWLNTNATALIALFVFLSGQIILLVGLFWSVAEIGVSNQAVDYEAQRVAQLPEDGS